MYKELKDQHPQMPECFFAFSNSQFTEGIEKKNLKDKKILNAGSGLYGTKEGLDEMMKFYEDNSKKISKQCTPQEVYDYEFWNHECEYTGLDIEAIEIVKSYFGEEGLKNLVRK